MLKNAKYYPLFIDPLQEEIIHIFIITSNQQILNTYNIYKVFTIIYLKTNNKLVFIIKYLNHNRYSKYIKIIDIFFIKFREKVLITILLLLFSFFAKSTKAIYYF